MPMETRCVHGNAIVAETLSPDLAQVTQNGTSLAYTDIVGLRQGFVHTYQGNTHSFPWFHAMIPTPAVINGQQTRLDSVFVLYRTARHVAVREVHVWDGQHFTKGFLVNNGFGDKTSAPPNDPFLEGENSFTIPRGEKPEVFFGVGVSIHVEFGLPEVHPTPGELPIIQFISAGAHFFY